MSAGWNISLFHYRNHGADNGRVLVGMQVPPSDKADFRRFWTHWGIPAWRRDRQIPAYRMFLPERRLSPAARRQTWPRHGRTVS